MIFNPNGPGRFKTKAENPDSQTCYFNVSDDEHMCNVFVSKCINEDNKDKNIYFEIEGVKSQTDNEIFDAELKLENLSENSSVDAGSSQLGFGIYDSRNERYIRKARFRFNKKSTRPKFLL